VRETWHHILGDVIPDHRSNLAFRADYPDCVDAKWDRPLPDADSMKWVPSIHMPRWACRDVYTVTKVRIERLQAITGKDAAHEGIELERWKTGVYPPYDMGLAWDEKILRDKFAALWDRLNGKKPGRAWADNPWVWVVEYDNPLWGQV